MAKSWARTGLDRRASASTSTTLFILELLRARAGSGESSIPRAGRSSGARPHPQALPAEVDRDVAERGVGGLDLPHQRAPMRGRLVAEQGDRAALAPGSVDLP